MVASLAVTPSVASITSSATSAASRCRRAITTLSFSAISFVLPLRRIPAVSTNRSAFPSNSTTSSTASRVVPAIGDTIARVVPVSAFSSVLFPTFGRPIIATEVSRCSNSPCVRFFFSPFFLRLQSVTGCPILVMSLSLSPGSDPAPPCSCYSLPCSLRVPSSAFARGAAAPPPQSHPATRRRPARAPNSPETHR